MIIQNSVGSSVPSGITSGGSGTVAHASNAATSLELLPAAKSASSSVSLRNAVEGINKKFQQNSTGMQFSIDQSTKESVVQLLDNNTGQVISQYPSEVTLAISAALAQDMKRGALVDQKA